MPEYESLDNHAVLAERTGRLIAFVRFLIIVAMGLGAAWAVFSAASDTQAIRETELDRKLLNTRIAIVQEGK